MKVTDTDWESSLSNAMEYLIKNRIIPPDLIISETSLKVFKVMIDEICNDGQKRNMDKEFIVEMQVKAMSAFIIGYARGKYRK